MTQALLVVDAQMSMFAGDWPVHEAELMLTRLEALIAHARATHLAVFLQIAAINDALAGVATLVTADAFLNS